MVKYRKIKKHCILCNGTGAKDKYYKMCPKCNGTGNFSVYRKIITICTKCDGHKELLIENGCDRCNSTGKVDGIIF